VMDASFGSRANSSYAWETRYGAYHWDSETGLYQIRNRFLHPKLGRWTARDPIEYRGSVNLYGYVNDKPINNVDPSGLQADSITAYYRSCACRLTAMARCECYCAPVTTGSQDSTECESKCLLCEKLATSGFKGKVDPCALCLCFCTLANRKGKEKCLPPIDCQKLCTSLKQC